MRFILKGPEPAELTAFKGKASEDWIPTFKGLRGREKQAMREQLCEEQRFICAYCQSEIAPENPTLVEITFKAERRASGGVADPPPTTRLEHLAPQSEHPKRDLDWRNILGVCLGKDPGGTAVCERARGHAPLHVSPVDDPDIEARFRFEIDGSMRGVDPDADADVATLRLDVGYFRKRRRAAIAGALFDTASPEALERRLAWLRSLHASDEALPEHYTAVVQVLSAELPPGEAP